MSVFINSQNLSEDTQSFCHLSQMVCRNFLSCPFTAHYDSGSQLYKAISCINFQLFLLNLSFSECFHDCQKLWGCTVLAHTLTTVIFILLFLVVSYIMLPLQFSSTLQLIFIIFHPTFLDVSCWQVFRLPSLPYCHKWK